MGRERERWRENLWNGWRAIERGREKWNKNGRGEKINTHKG